MDDLLLQIIGDEDTMDLLSDDIVRGKKTRIYSLDSYPILARVYANLDLDERFYRDPDRSNLTEEELHCIFESDKYDVELIGDLQEDGGFTVIIQEV